MPDTRLRAAIDRIVTGAEGRTLLSAVDAPASLDIDDLETWAIVKALRQTAGNVSQAARVLGISRDTLHTKLKIKNIDRKAVGASAEN